MRARGIALVFATCSLALAEPLSSYSAHVAAPEIMIFHGEELGRRVVLASFEENHRFLLSAADSAPVTLRELENRPSYSVAMFWGGIWRSYTRSAEALAKLDPARATQQARFYPAQRGAEPILVLWGERGERQMRHIRKEGLDILARRGVPVEFAH